MAKKKKSVPMTRGESLLIELLTEELPPKSLKRLSEAFAQAVYDGLKEKYFLSERSQAQAFATPRRLAVRVTDVVAKQPDRVVERKGPAVAAGFDAAGQPTRALAGFARSCGAEIKQLQRRSDERGEYFVYQAKVRGEPLARHLSGIVDAALKQLPVAKLMRWGAGEAQFVRPVHGLTMLHGSSNVAGVVLGVKSANKTRGHRFLSKGPVTLKRADDYAKTLERQGKVIASFERRRELIVRALDKTAAKLNGRPSWRVGNDAELIDEVTSIVEAPRVYAGAFDQAFLAVPRECLIISMQQHQKYFPLADAAGRLQPRFLFVANMSPPNAVPIIHGNERVLRARLADAKFFYDQDRRTKLAERVPRLANVVYHNKLGSQLERVQRMQKVSAYIAAQLQGDVAQAERAAYLCKADLLTDMVGEFPELQGIMGRYYAEHDGEPRAVADAIEQHYFPRSAAGELPAGPIALALALADKLDALVGMFGIGLTPSGDKDPFGLRRAAIGLLRMLIERKLALDVKELIERARAAVTQAPLAPNVVQQVQDFLFDRLRAYLKDKDYAADEIEAVLALKPTRLDQIPARLDALKKFRALPEGMALAAANKRIHNILRQAGKEITPALDGALLKEDAEKELAARLSEIVGRVGPLVTSGDYSDALKELSALHAPVDAFFERVLVMADDANLRMARLQLLARIHHEFRQIADISRLQG